MAKLKIPNVEAWQRRDWRRHFQPSLKYVKEVEVKFSEWSKGMSTIRDFMGTALAQRRHNEKCWVHETVVPQRMDKAEIHLTFVNGDKKAYDPTVVTTMDILEELKLHREKLDLETELELTARRYDFGADEDDKKKDKGGAAAKKKKK